MSEVFDLLKDRLAERDKRSPGEKTERGVMQVAFLFLVGIVAISLSLATTVPEGAAQSGVGVGITAFLLFFAAASIGAGLGFLFGLPRSRFVDRAATPGSGAEARENAASAGSAETTELLTSTHYLTNSNLIKVSDWLTTIIIGLGLVNLGNIRPAIDALSKAVSKPLGGAEYAGTVGVTLVIVGAIAGMLLTYLWTMTRVRELLEAAENEYARLVPNLVGRTVADAKQLLGTTTLRLAAPSDATDESVIASQSLRGGRRVAVTVERVS